MSQTRIEKHQKYRESLMKQDSVNKEKDKETFSSYEGNEKSTSTLPINEVIQKASDSENEDIILITKHLKRKYTSLTIAIVAFVILVAIIIIVAVAVWRK